MKTNYRRKVTARQEYPWDSRSWKVPGFRFFRSKEAIALRRVREAIKNGDCPGDVNFPYRTRENDNPWNYD